MSRRSPSWFGLFAVLAGLSCSIIVETEEIDSGCGSGKKLCNGACVNVDDPAYGCRQEGCGPPCQRENGVPRCEANDCEYATCLYGWGCTGCVTRVLSNPRHCGYCNNNCDVLGMFCDVDRCILLPDAGAGGTGE